MVAPFIKSTLYRAVLPAILLFAAVLRPSFLSCGYLLFALIGPLLPSVVSTNPLPGCVRGYVWLSTLFSLAAMVAQLAYQIYEPVSTPNESKYKCGLASNEWLRSAGFVRFHGSAGLDSARAFLPELVAFAASLLAHIAVACTAHQSFSEADISGVQSVRTAQSRDAQEKPVPRPFGTAFKRCTNLLIIIAVAAMGCVQPSILNAVYFVFFLFVASWWGVYKPLRHTAYNRIKKLMIFYAALHLLAIYAYQIPAVQKALPETSLAARLVGLSSIVSVRCPSFWQWLLTPGLVWTTVANPILLVCLYCCLIAQWSITKRGSRSYIDDDDAGSSVHEELLGEEERAGNSLPLQRVTSEVIDRHKISHMFNGPGQPQSAASQGVVAAASFFLYHAYVFGLISMMVWALLYHSVFGLVFLVLACALWMFRDTRGAAFNTAWLIVAYTEFLLLAQYVCSLNVTRSELRLNDTLEMVGFVSAGGRVDAMVTLLVKVVLSLPVFLLLRLALRERYYNSLSEHERQRRVNDRYGTFGGPSTSTTASQSNNHTARPRAGTDKSSSSRSAAAVHVVSHWLAKTWIFVVATVLLLVSLQSPPVLYTIGFFLLWALLIVYLKTSWRFFRGITYVFWTGVVFYTACVIISLYIYQFPYFPVKWREWTGLSEEWSDAIGLINYRDKGENSALFARLLAPISLFVVTMLQLKFFHEPWSKIVQPVRNALNGGDEAGPSSHAEAAGGETDNTLLLRIAKFANEMVELLWRLVEVHISKLVFIMVIIVAAGDISAMYVPLVVLVSLALCLPHSAAHLLGLFMCVYLALVTLAKMVFQLSLIPSEWGPAEWSGEECNRTSPTLPQWTGFRKGVNMFNYLSHLVIALIACAAQSVVVYRQRTMRATRGQRDDQRRRVFPNANPIFFDKSVTEMLQFFVDFGFYKFGLEACYVMMGVVAWVRMDAVGAILLLWLIFFTSSSRPVVRTMWPLLLCYLAIMLPLQYAINVGLPPTACIDYPWSHIFTSGKGALAQTKRFIIWLGLADYDVERSMGNLIADFFLLLVVSYQAVVFRQEGPQHPAGDNETIYSDGRYEIKSDNPRYDFIAEQRSFVDLFKIAVFLYGHWFTLIMVLVAGLGGTSLFALGYICLSFWLLWQGNNLYLMSNYTATIRRWRLLLFYTVLVMFCKLSLQVVGCVFLEQLDSKHGCMVRQLFSIICVNRQIIETSKQDPLWVGDHADTCQVQSSETRIGFDTVALLCLVMQLRILHSWYFQHCMVDFRTEIVLGNRGAVLKNQLVEKEMKEQQQQQDNKFADIKKRTDAIRAQYEKQQQRGVAFEPQTYGQAKRAGDYYMFDYDPSTEQLVRPVECFVPEVDPNAEKFDKLDPSQLVYTAVTKDMDMAGTLKNVELAEKYKDEEERMAEAVKEDVTQGDEEEESPSAVVSVFRFVQKILCSILDWTSAWLNRQSREHRYVAHVLDKEKTRLKENCNESLIDSTRKLTEVRHQMDMTQLQLVQSERDIVKMEDEVAADWQAKSSLARFVNAVGHCVAAHTDLLVYFLTLMSHAKTAGLITLPLPLMVFFWGTLSNPRPSKFFWVAMIAYTELVIAAKFMCQFGFMPWNNGKVVNENIVNPYSYEKVLGIQKRDYFAFWDVALLIALFFHRYMLRKLGLWKDANVSETFNDTTRGIDNPTSVEKSADRVEAGGSEEDEAHTDAVSLASEPAPSSPNCLSRFFAQLFHPKFRYIRDLYPFMFAIDMCCFLIVAFGYSSFGEGGSGSVVNDIQSSRIPLTFVVMLIAVTMMIVVDRGLYLRKAVYCKLAYQVMTVVFMHVWIFFVLPAITNKAAWLNGTAQFLYVVKGIYLLISAWQIRNGYPTLCIGNLLTHAYGLANMIFFKIFMAIPFLFELRTAIDWTWTDTSMPLFDYFNMENFYATIYNLKCARTFEAAYPAPRGVAKGKLVKYLMGLPMICIIVIIIWCPLLLFSLLNKIGVEIKPSYARMSIAVEGYPALYTIEAQGNELQVFQDDWRQRLNSRFAAAFNVSDEDSKTLSRQAVSFINEYTDNDMLKTKFRPESETFWPISTDSLVALKAALDGNQTMKMEIHLEFTRPRIDASKDPLLHSSDFSIDMEAVNSTTRDELKAALAAGTGKVVIPMAVPLYIIVPNEGEIKTAKALLSVMAGAGVDLNTTYGEIELTISGSGTQTLWTAQLIVPPSVGALYETPDNINYGNDRSKRYVQLVTFVDRAFPSYFAKYAQGGVIAMYMALVLLVGKAIRGIITNAPLDVIISEIPNPDFLLKICLDIYLVREARDFVLEQDLFAKLIFLFRSPATLIQWTRYKHKSKEE